MQTFLPLPNYRATAQCLDYRRLGKQRVEAKQILELLLKPHTYSRWMAHPVVKLWRGYELSLYKYGVEMCTEWRDRGYVDNLLDWFQDTHERLYLICSKEPIVFSEDFHRSHRAALLAKNYEHYSKMGWKETPVINYIWKDVTLIN
jgi:hypothetical protein